MVFKSKYPLAWDVWNEYLILFKLNLKKKLFYDVAFHLFYNEGNNVTI